MVQIESKEFFKKFGILTGIIFLLAIILIYSIFISKKSWNTNLKLSITNVLNEYEPDVWEVGDLYPLENTIIANSNCYSLKNKNNSSIEYKVMIIRILTFYGPLPAVYIIDENNKVTFAGISSLHGRINKQLTSNKYNKNIDYWKNVIEQLFEEKGSSNEK